MHLCKSVKKFIIHDGGSCRDLGPEKELPLIKLVEKALACKHISVRENNWYKVDSDELSVKTWQGLGMR